MSSKWAFAALALLILVGVTWWIRSRMPDTEATANTRVLMDAESGELVRVNLRADGGAVFGPFPMTNPHTGRDTLYPTEMCYSATCAATGGTHVILNHYLGKDGETLCPKCGAPVHFHNSDQGQAAAGRW